MKDRIRAFFASILIILYTCSVVGASSSKSVLGPEKISGGRIQIAEGTYYNENVFYSDQSGVGKQSEYFFEYEANDSVVPIISNGNSIYGRHNVLESYNILKNQKLNPIAGINADFYSLQTGVPLSHCITDGYVVTKDSQPQDAVGFLEDGTAFIGYMGIYMTINKDGQSVVIENVNKYRQPYAVYLFTDEFGSETYDTAPGMVIVLSDISDRITIEGSATAIVESVDYYQGSVGIPKGKYVISINDNLKEQDNYKFFEALKPGDEVVLKTSFEGDERFKDAVTVMGGSQGRLLNNGVVNDKLEKGAAPRTAIGVKEDGSTVFYTIDGRQTNHSYGVQLTTLAKRLAELGCVDAINLDGGGSTTCALVMPGYSEFTVANSPSDGSVRKNANFFFLINTEKPTGVADKMYIYPFDMKLLSGAASKVTAAMTDKNYYAVDARGVEYTASRGIIQPDGQFSVTGNGSFEITALKDGISETVTYNVYDNPTDIIARTSSGVVDSIAAEPGEQIQFTASAKYYNSELVSQNSCYSWTVDDERIGTVDGNGLFTAGEIEGSKGELLISAGDTTKKVEIKIKGETDTPENYHIIDGFMYDGDTISVNITNELGVKAQSEKIVMKIDRNEVEAEFADGVLTYLCPEEFEKYTHRVSVTVTNEFDNTTTAFFEIKGTEAVECGFTDIEQNWAKEIILYMNKNGVINGYTEDSGELVFRPQDGMTRAQFAVMISNYLGVDTSSYDGVELPFTDADELPSWAASQIKAMYSMNVITGRSADDGVYFDPNTQLTRAEAATILARILPDRLLKAEISFEDKDEIPDWAEEGIAVLVNLKAMNGYEDNTILPSNYITRAECTKLLYSVF